MHVTRLIKRGRRKSALIWKPGDLPRSATPKKPSRRGEVYEEVSDYVFFCLFVVCLLVPVAPSAKMGLFVFFMCFLIFLRNAQIE